MTGDIIQSRLSNQKLAATRFTDPAAVVGWFGAMQAQDFAAAKWALALRTKDKTEKEIEDVFNNGQILRIHIMRPTWHFVTPSDIRWLLALTSPRVHQYNGYYYRQSGFDRSIFRKSNDVIQSVLQGGKQLTREELNNELRKEKIPTEHVGLSYALMQAELDGFICSGPRKGKQFTYMLLDERVPPTKDISRDEALAKLVKRYFQSHGPAQIQDFVWWSGLTVADAKKGIALAGHAVRKEERNGKTYWWLDSSPSVSDPPDCFLLPGFDEYFIAYKDRSDVLDKNYVSEFNRGGGMVRGAVVVGGRMAGIWKRIFEKKQVVLTIQLFEQVTSRQMELLESQVQRYGKFMGTPASFILK